MIYEWYLILVRVQAVTKMFNGNCICRYWRRFISGIIWLMHYWVWVEKDNYIKSICTGCGVTNYQPYTHIRLVWTSIYIGYYLSTNSNDFELMCIHLHSSSIKTQLLSTVIMNTILYLHYIWVFSKRFIRFQFYSIFLY